MHIPACKALAGSSYRGCQRFVSPTSSNPRTNRVPDPETAPPSRTRMLETLGVLLRNAESQQATSAALLMISVNGIGAVNARLGTTVGDELISETERLLKTLLTRSDKIARFGSNTLAIILDGCGTAGLASAGKTMIAAVDTARFPTSAGPLAATVSIGGVALPEQARSVTDAVACALDALEVAKQRPTGAFVAHDARLASERMARRAEAMPGLVMRALDEKRMMLALQPVVATSTRKVMFYEGLLRLYRPDGVLVPAVDFIADAEELGLVRHIDRHALQLGLDLLERHPRLRLSINISSLTVGDEEWASALYACAARRDDIPPRLIIEMTETARIGDFNAAREFLDRLRALGCRIAIDDFGAGHTSLRHLLTLNADILKIDGALVARIPGDARSCALVKAVIDMANALGLETVAEWIGEESAAAFLEASGANYLQGFLFGEPTPADDLRKQGLL